MEVNGAGVKLDCTPLWRGGRGGANLQVYSMVVLLHCVLKTLAKQTVLTWEFNRPVG